MLTQTMTTRGIATAAIISFWLAMFIGAGVLAGIGSSMLVDAILN